MRNVWYMNVDGKCCFFPWLWSAERCIFHWKPDRLLTDQAGFFPPTAWEKGFKKPSAIESKVEKKDQILAQQSKGCVTVMYGVKNNNKKDR